MLRAATAALFAFATAPVLAADFSKVSCDSPGFEHFMQTRLGHGKSANTGQPMADRFDFGPISQATTMSNTGRTISCALTVGLDTRGGTRQIHGRFTAMLDASNRVSWRWAPGS
jgi:hypothetical protein